MTRVADNLSSVRLRVKQYVNHDRLDDEVMVIDLETGSYFAFDGAAADAWTLFVAGATPGHVGTELARRYDVTVEVATSDVAGFLDQLVAEGLLVEGEGGELADEPAAQLAAGSVPYTRPAIDKYDDLQDLLLLDPIHEVVEEAGWPTGRAG